MVYLSMSESAERRSERDRELMQFYCEIYDTLSQRRVQNIHKVALDLALTCGSPRYWVGFDRAYVVVGKMLRDKKSVKFKSQVIKKLWLEVTSKTKMMMEEGNLSIAKALDLVLENCRASRFFMSEEHAWYIIKRELSRNNIRRSYGRKIQ